MAITDTSRNPRRDWLSGGNPRAIEQQEAEGQQELAASKQLPIEGFDPDKAELLGIRVSPNAPKDPLFHDVQLPDGMVIRPTEHSMWSDLVDADGVVVASIFYKAAFYDRRASIRFA